MDLAYADPPSAVEAATASRGGALVARARPTQWTLRDEKSWRTGKLELLFDNPKLSDIKLTDCE